MNIKKKMSSKEIENNNKNVDDNIIPCLNCGFQTFTTFSTDSVVRLSTDAFSIKEKALIALEYNECFLVLFYTENAESKKLAKIWSIVAQQVPGPIFAGCNVLLEKKVAEAFSKIKSHPSHAFKPYALHGWPVIIVYREGFPTAVYNGPYEVQSISDWALTLACSAGYFEPVQDYGGIQAYNLLEMETPTPYVNVLGKPPTKKVVSTEYTKGKGVRGNNPNIPLVLEGTNAARNATIAARQQEAEKKGVILTDEAASSNIDQVPNEKTSDELIKDVKFNPDKISNSQTSDQPGNKEVSPTPYDEGESEKSESESEKSESESEKSESESETPEVKPEPPKRKTTRASKK